MPHKILVAEDEMIVAFDLCETVEEAGYEVEGPHAGLSSAMLAFQKEKPDIAILDVSLKDGLAYPLAKLLVKEDIPVIFHSGIHSRDSVERNFPEATVLNKPCPPAEMLATVNAILEPAEAVA